MKNQIINASKLIFLSLLVIILLGQRSYAYSHEAVSSKTQPLEKITRASTPQQIQTIIEEALMRGDHDLSLEPISKPLAQPLLLPIRQAPVVKLLQYNVPVRDDLVELTSFFISNAFAEQLGVLTMYSLLDGQQEGTAYLLEVFANPQALETFSREKQNSELNQEEQYQDLLNKPGVDLQLIPALVQERSFVQTDTTTPALMTLSVKEEKIEEFKQELTSFYAQEFTTNPALQAVYLLQSEQDPSQWFVVLTFTSEQDYINFKQSEAYSQFMQRQEANLNGELDLEVQAGLLMTRGLVDYNAQASSETHPASNQGTTPESKPSSVPASNAEATPQSN
ncbi:hypothetical protein CJP74_07250 [Psittacicella melopsittaci]|uniref:ABM domain-containing protein n=1 Tax=Psittacicella melopsittaci TaxID=2028576 RepID=A0A3A1Y1Z2_9GAMM|nr:antibiotic biosynthesis monooxygenase family protein [Psittacicella melopsittaci]RIY31461.1 hypothetical protein CJP74_07250 [Psittacicella melopsittaci]